MKIILLVADGLQSAAIGPYGNEWIETPHIIGLAGSSVVFDNHFAASPSTESPSVVRQCRHAFGTSEANAGDWLTTLRKNGVACDWQLQPSSISHEQIRAAIRGSKAQVLGIEVRDLLPPWDLPVEVLAASFEDWEHSEEPEPVLDPQPGLIDGEDDIARECLQRTYAAVVRQFDEFVGAVVEELDAEDFLLLTAGVGQNLGEHGLVGQELPWLFEELIHLPLFIRLPNNAEGGRRVNHMTHSLDIGPTILEVLQLPMPEYWHGASLLPLCFGGPRIREYICCRQQVGDRAELALQTADEKIIVPQGDPNRRPMYFVKPDDRWDMSDLRQAYLERAEALELVLLDYVAASSKPRPLLLPPLPQLENNNGHGETRRGEHDASQGAGSVRGHQGDQEGAANQ